MKPASTTASTGRAQTGPAEPSDLSTAGDRPCNDTPGYVVQVGSFGVPENAAGLRDKLNDAYGDARILRKESPNGPLYAVLVGSGSDRDAATALMRRLRRDNVGRFRRSYG